MRGLGSRRRATVRFASVLAAAALGSLAALAAATYVPARRLGGDVPQAPFNAVGWIEATVDVELNAAGAMVNTTTLRATPGGADFVLPALRSWRFRPATNDGKAVASHVLVAAMMRPPQFFDPAGGLPASDLGKPGAGVAYPASVARPGYPVDATGDGVVLVEVSVAPDGRVEKAAIVGAPSAFNNAALAAAKQWTFRPARHEGATVPAAAYLIFGFRMPVG